MTATNHALTGAIIGLTIANPAIAVPMAVLSHFVLDMLPHYGDENRLAQRSFGVYLLIDAALCGLLVLLLAVARPTNWLLAAVCAFTAAAPDFLWIRKFTASRKKLQFHPNRIEKLLHDIQWFQRPIGALVEVAWFFASLTILAQFV